MPFAMIAITLLLLTAFYGIVCYSVEQKEDNTENITEELMSISDGIEDTEKYIEAGLGNIINDISTNADGGNLLKRIETFESIKESWFKDTFPLRDNGSSVELVEHNIELSLKNMSLSSDEAYDKNVASYLEASGTVTVRYITESTETEEILSIEATGLSGLPFIINSATKFELSSSSGQSILSEMISYQLTALAQYRILNGFGSVSESGEKGTDSIITNDDVKAAFRSSLSVLESICFRSNGEDINEYHSNEHIDMAELLIADDNGNITLDLSSIFSQTIVSLIDVILVRWFDLIGGGILLDIIDTVVDVIRNCVNCIVSFFTGGTVDRSSGTYYLKELMNNYDIDERSFRYLDAGSYSIMYGGGTYDVGNGETVTIPAMTIDGDYRNVDLFDWGGWDGFVDSYHGGRNDIREYIKTYIHSIANGIASGIGVVTIESDPYDDTSLIDNLEKGIDDALNNGWNNTMNLIDSTVSKEKVSDPLYSAMYRKIVDCRESIYHESQTESAIINNIKGTLTAYIVENYGTMADDSLIDIVIDEIVTTGQIEKCSDYYSDKVSEKMDLFSGVLTKVPKDTNSFIKQLIINAGKQAFRDLGIFGMLKNSAVCMCNEMISCMNVNSQSGLIGLENDDSYLLYDGYGNSHREYVSVNDDYQIDVKITSAIDNDSKNWHNVGFDEISMASYTATCTVRIDAEIDYDVGSYTSVLGSLGAYDARYSNCIAFNTCLDIPLVSGWGLAGVSYQPSTNIFIELWEKLLEFLEPILGPLVELYNAIESVFNRCSTAIVEISAFITELVTKIYEILMIPLELLIDFAESATDTIASCLVKAFNLGLNKQTIVLGLFGFTLKIETKLASMFKTTKTLAKVTVEKTIGDTTASVFLEIKQKSDRYLMQFGGDIVNDLFKIDVDVDPLMKFGKELVSIDGYVRDVAFDISLPKIETYDEIEVKLSDVPGVSETISNIPLPISGVKGSFDMGFELKYNLPMNSGLVINEFESNPLGDDAGKEWAEIYNGTLSPIDVTGYILSPGSDNERSVTLSGTIEPLGHMVVYFNEESLCNGKTKNYNGEKLTLFDDEGNKINETGWKKDSANNDFSWQRKTDGASTWVFKKSTEGKANGNLLDANVLEEKFVVQQMELAIESALDRFDGHLKSYDDVSEFLKYVIQYFIKNLITKIADCIVSAMVYLQFELTDYTSSMHGGIRVALMMDSDLVEEGLKWILSQIGFLTDYVKSPSCDNPAETICENTYLSTTIYAEVSTPSFLRTIGERVNIGVTAAVNIAGLCSLVGIDEGKWKARIGLVLEDVPAKLLPSPLRKNTDKHCDLWLIKAEFGEK